VSNSKFIVLGLSAELTRRTFLVHLPDDSSGTMRLVIRWPGMARVLIVDTQSEAAPPARSSA
jgi:hypothetical protein